MDCYNIIYERERDGKIPNLNKNKISGIFNAEKDCGSYIDWNEFYIKKKERSRAKNSEITEKHLMYYEALKNLGFFDNLTPNSIILQLGVGHGQSLRTIIEKQTHIQPIGLDISFEALLFFKNNSPGNDVELICGDVLSLPFSDESIDRMFEVGVVEHFYEEDPFLGRIVDREKIVDSLKEAKRVLKKDGRIAFIQPSKHSTLPISQKINELTKKWEFGYQENFSISEFAQLLRIAGFVDIHFAILQAPDDFPRRIRVGDRLLKSFYTLTGQYKKSELTGALFCMIVKK